MLNSLAHLPGLEWELVGDGQHDGHRQKTGPGKFFYVLFKFDMISYIRLSELFYQYPNQNGWMSYPDDNYTIFYNGILTVTDIYFGLALPFDVITVDDTIFYGTAGTYNLELIRQ